MTAEEREVLIEECAKVAEGFNQYANSRPLGGEIANEIRRLKDKV